MRVLLTGAAGFIGSRVDAALRAAGHDVVGVDALLPAAHGPNPVLPPGCQRVDVRDASALAPLLAGVDLVCHQAAMVGAGVNAADAPAYGGHNDFATTVLLAQMFAAGVRRLVLASSMVVYGQGRYDCPQHGPVDPLPRRRADLDNGVFEHRCPGCGEPVIWQLVDEDAPLRPRSLYAASKTAQEHYALAWSEASGGSVVALRYHNVYGPGMPRDTPYSGVAAIFRSAVEKGKPPKVFEDGGPDAGLRARGRRGPRRTSPRCIWVKRTATGLPRSTSVPGAPSRSFRWQPRYATPAVARCPRPSPGTTAAATCATLSPIPRGPPACSGSARPSIQAKDCVSSRSRRFADRSSYDEWSGGR
ncbi:UDP-glucose 4-epimerase galE3 [Mycobacterium tuberculosis C]|nr:UDP-glucose 4-epimerase galE3 [Mycobacterium tuberculosis C]